MIEVSLLDWEQSTAEGWGQNEPVWEELGREMLPYGVYKSLLPNRYHDRARTYFADTTARTLVVESESYGQHN